MPIRRSSILERTCRSHFNICTSNRGLQSKSHTAQRSCAFITTATKAGGGVLSKSSAPKRSCTATVSSISSRSRGSHRSAFSIFCRDLYVSGIAKTGTPLPGALDMLRALSERYDLYITTNGNPISQPGRLKNSGVTAFMKGCFISDEIGAAKPDKKYFDYVLARIPGASTENCLVIGDSLSADIKGAQNAGLDSLWYNPNRKANTLPHTAQL